MVYPRTIVYLWLTNTTRMNHLEDHIKVPVKMSTFKEFSYIPLISKLVLLCYCYGLPGLPPKYPLWHHNTRWQCL